MLTAAMCGHRWEPASRAAAAGWHDDDHQCGRPAGHTDWCRCRCGALTPEACGHRWGRPRCADYRPHVCQLDADHLTDPGPMPRPHRCGCGATTDTTRET